ncbi:MAG: choice-of-anchor B family protein [Planctomycetota bacterium]|jgi:choice-of-anchor B domain-containing protein
MKRFAKTFAVVCAGAVLAVSGAAAQDDGVSSLPVFKGPFPETHNMRFLSQIDPEDLGALEVPGVWAKGMMNDLGGWTSPGGEEYALATNSGGIAIVRVTDPENPEFLGRVESQNPFDFRNIWGDPATFGDYAYFTTEIDDSSIVIIDMSGADALQPVDDPFTDLPLDTYFVAPGGYDGAHNIVIHEDTGYAYLAGVHLKDGAANNACAAEEPARFNTLILDVFANPIDPPVVACLDDVGEHDFHVVNYTGPDVEHQGKEIAFVFDGRDREGQAVDNPIGGYTLIWDVTDKGNIVELAKFRTEGMVFSHNGATTGEQDFLFIGDEIDELVLANWSISGIFTQPPAETTNKPQTGTYVIDIRDLDNPVPFQRFENGTVGLDHNFQVVGDKLHIASYTSGTRILEIGRDGNDDVVLEEIATMDTEPRLPGNILNINQEERFGNAFLGQWGIFVFDSGTIIVSDINNGLIVMRESDMPCHGIVCSK